MNREIAKRFVAAGVLLFLLGLVTGFAIPSFLNPRMGLASHLEGVMNGTFLIALGAAWHHLNLSRRLETVAFWLIVYGSFSNWAFVSLAAIFGTSETTPIAGEGYSGTAVQEQFVSLGLLSVGVTILCGLLIVIYGLLLKRDA